MKVKALIKSFIPPILMEAKRRLLAPQQKEFSGVFDRFNKVQDDGVWQSDEWLGLSKLKLDRLTSTPPMNERSYLDAISLVINQESSTKTCRVLDFGGGTGFSFHCVRPSLLRPENVSWHVVDNARLTDLGKKYRGNLPLEFHQDLPRLESVAIVLINTSVQYLDPWREILGKLMGYAAAHFFFTRLLCAAGRSFIAKQTIFGRHTPCLFISRTELSDLLGGCGYRLISDIPCWEDDLSLLLSPEVKELACDWPSRDLVFHKAN